jgi:hypothetical protein
MSDLHAADEDDAAAAAAATLLLPPPPRLPRPPGASEDGLLATQLTVVLNTSPCTCHPATRLLEETVASLALAPGLRGCRLLIVADGFNLRERTRVKSGCVTPAVAAAYARYLRRVALLARQPGSPLQGAELVALQQRHGCAHALRRGLARCATPFVCVVQHGAAASARRCSRGSNPALTLAAWFAARPPAVRRRGRGRAGARAARGAGRQLHRCE